MVEHSPKILASEERATSIWMCVCVLRKEDNDIEPLIALGSLERGPYFLCPCYFTSVCCGVGGRGGVGGYYY